MPDAEQDTIEHASAVAFQGRGVVILGASGSGKSTLALELMALGAALVSDDRTRLFVRDNRVFADCPAPLSGMIEARQVGLLNAVPHGVAPVELVVDLDQVEQDRLPEYRTRSLLGLDLPLLHKAAHAGFPAAIRQYILCGRRA